MILVTTAGKVEAEAARLLAARGESVRVLVRNPEKVAALSRAGVEIAEGDLTVPDSIDAAMRDVSSVILVSPAIPDQELNVVHHAVRAGVDHVVKITSKASADSPIARRRGQAEIEEGLIASGLGYTLLRNNVYMQNLLMLAPAIAHDGSFGANTRDGRAALIDSRDVAAVAAEIAADPAPHVGTTYWPTGPESLSYADAAAILSEVLGRPIGFRSLTDEEQTRAMIDAGIPAHIAEMNSQALALLAQGDSDWITGDVPAILGRPAGSSNGSPGTTPGRSPEARALRRPTRTASAPQTFDERSAAEVLGPVERGAVEARVADCRIDAVGERHVDERRAIVLDREMQQRAGVRRVAAGSQGRGAVEQEGPDRRLVGQQRERQ